MKPWRNGPLARAWLSAGALLAVLAAPSYLHRYFGRGAHNESPARSIASAPEGGAVRYVQVIAIPMTAEIAEPNACALSPRHRHRASPAVPARK